jgi:DNA (cytosine-5)-methyltransferase 1
MLKVIEFFAGIGSQAKALKRRNIEHKIVGISEWDVNAIISYDAIHTNDGVDYTEGMNKLQIYNELKNYTFSTDGKKPCDLKRVKEKTLRQLYNANKRVKNLGDITKIQNAPIADLWTYSFPCQDLSIAGKRAGLEKGTRSGLL